MPSFTRANHSEPTGVGRPDTGARTTGHRSRTTIALLLGILLLPVMASTAFAADPAPGAGPPPEVGVAPVILKDVNPPAEYVGHVEAIQTVDLTARVEGFIEKVDFKEGEDVSAGKVLFVIEQGPYKARVAADRARVAQAEAELNRAASHLKRLRTARGDSIPEVDLDTALASELSARAQVAQAQATLTLSELNLGYTTIQAPITGRIGRTAFTRGNMVGPASGRLARIVQMDPVRVIYSMSENDLAAIHMAMKDSAQNRHSPILTPRLRLADGSLRDAPGRVDFVDNAVDAATGTIAVWARFDNPDGGLIPGQYLNVLVNQTAPQILAVVSQAAVQQDSQGPYVLVVGDDGKAAVRRVVTGPVTGEFWAIASGLAEGEKVIVEGTQKVQPGMTVKAVPVSAGQGR